MATIVTRKGKRGVRYQVRIHRHGIHQSATFATRDAARTWAQMVEGYAAAHGAGLVPEGVALHTVAEAIERYRHEVLPRKGPGTQQSYDGHLRWWQRRLGSTRLSRRIGDHVRNNMIAISPGKPIIHTMVHSDSGTRPTR